MIEPRNAYLDGCGPLDEVTGEGTPAPGRFWAEALGCSACTLAREPPRVSAAWA